MTRQVVVLAGGLSHERDVSLRSGSRLLEALQDRGLEVTQRDSDGELIGWLTATRPDAAIVVLHGSRGEQRVIQSILDTHAAAPLEPLIVALMDSLIDEHAADPRELHALLDQQEDGSRGLRQALGEILGPKAIESAVPPERIQFVIPAMMDVLVHEAVLSRPSGCALAAAKREASRAVISTLRA